MRRSGRGEITDADRRSGSRRGPGIQVDRYPRHGRGRASLRCHAGNESARSRATDRTFPRPGLHDGQGSAVASRLGSSAGRPRIGRPPTPAASDRRWRHCCATPSRSPARLGSRLRRGGAHLARGGVRASLGPGCSAALTSMGLDPALIEEALAFRSIPALIGATRSRRMTPARTAAPRSRGPVRAVRRQGEGRRRSTSLLACIDEPPGRAWQRRRPPDLCTPSDVVSIRRNFDADSCAAARLRRPRSTFASDATPEATSSRGARGADRPAWQRPRARTDSVIDPWDRHPWGSRLRRDARGSAPQAGRLALVLLHRCATATTFAPPTGGRSAIDTGSFTKVPKRLPGRPKTEVVADAAVPDRWTGRTAATCPRTEPPLRAAQA